MDDVDGRLINDARFKQWRCGRGHVMGVTERVKVTLRAGETTLRYFTTRLLVFQEAVDMEAEVPAEIRVASSLDGRILSMVHRCSVCGEIREWHPEARVVEMMAESTEDGGRRMEDGGRKMKDEG